MEANMRYVLIRLLRVLLSFGLAACGSGGSDPAPPVVTPESIRAAKQSAQASLEFIRRMMDEYHDRIPVYEDVSSAGNHFVAYAKIPDAAAPVSMNGSSTDSPYRGATAVRCEFVASTPNAFGGFYFQNGVLISGSLVPVPNFGEIANAGVDLTGERCKRW
jgi:hypothetical protein